MSIFKDIYNALTIHSICYLKQNDEIKESRSMLDQASGRFWSTMAYRIGLYVFSLDDIEHGILRGVFFNCCFQSLLKLISNKKWYLKANRPHPSRNESSFQSNDARLKYVVKKFDPRIHFALNCGAKVKF